MLGYKKVKDIVDKNNMRRWVIYKKIFSDDYVVEFYLNCGFYGWIKMWQKGGSQKYLGWLDVSKLLNRLNKEGICIL